MGVTAIKHITNNSPQTVFIHNHENPSNSVTINPNSTATIDIWIPWCTSQSDWQWNHYLSVELPNTSRTLYWIWQQDNFVRYSTDGQFHDQGTHVPGVAQIDADRLLTINSDSSIVFTPDLIQPGDYRSFAGPLVQALMGWYDQGAGLWSTPLWLVTKVGLHYWWNSANALEAVIDYSRLTQSSAYNASIANTFNLCRHGNLLLGTQDNFLNDFYDDEGWWALTWIKAYDLTGVQDYLNMAETIFNDMANGWSGVLGGGLPWRKSLPDSKGCIQNELFITVAARLYQRAPNGSCLGKSYLTWATMGWDWFKNSGLIGTKNDATNNVVLNLVNDALGSPATYPATPWPGDPIYTYTQGVIIGGLTDLYKCTGDTTKLQQAHAIAHAVITPNPIFSLVDNNGILWEKMCEPTNTCEPDGTQFKGILIRNLAYLNQTDPRDEYRAFILNNAASIMYNNRNNSNQCGLHWAGPVDATEASRQSSALDAINAAIPFAWSAAYVSQSVPTALTTGQRAAVQVTMKNTGATTWSASEITPPVRLGSQNPQDNTTWSLARVDVPSPVAPSTSVTFAFTVRAPANAGSYNFQWRMVQETVSWFGDTTPDVHVTVSKGKETKDLKDKEGKAEKDAKDHKDRDIPAGLSAAEQPQQVEAAEPGTAQGQAFIGGNERPAVGAQALVGEE